MLPFQSSITMQALTALRAAFAGMSVQDDSSSSGVLECEVVEVKNTCPFRQQSGLTKKGKPRSSYLLRDPGPRQKVSQENAVAYTPKYLQGYHAALQGAIWTQAHTSTPAPVLAGCSAAPHCDSRADRAVLHVFDHDLGVGIGLESQLQWVTVLLL